ncbi:cobalamin-dependent protein [bacterium]|nr:cobalamin-dependent protein [bacterium]
MRILLVQSYLGRKEKPIYPIGLALLSSLLKEHEVKTVDPNIFNDPLGELRTFAREFKPQMLGVSLRNVDTTQIRDPFVYFNGMIDTINIVTDIFPDIPVIAGGGGFSIYAKEIMKKVPRIECGVFLEGEDSFPELIDKWPNVDNVKGLFLRRNNEVIFTGKRAFPEVKNIPFPDWESVPIAPYKDQLDAVGVQTKRGCALKCAYCNYPFLNGSGYRFREPGIVVDEIEKLITDYQLERFIFVDSVFNIPREHAETILREMIKRRLIVKWTGWYNERALDRDFVKLAVEAGCELFSFSPDGFSDESLKGVGKNIRNDDIIRVYNLMKEFPQAMVGYNFFINPPGQTFGALLKLLAFGVKVKRTFRGRLCGFLLGSIRIEPDTPIYQRALSEGFITEDTPMLVDTGGELKKLFYRPPNSVALDAALKMYISLRKIKHKIKPPREL